MKQHQTRAFLPGALAIAAGTTAAPIAFVAIWLFIIVSITPARAEASSQESGDRWQVHTSKDRMTGEVTGALAYSPTAADPTAGRFGKASAKLSAICDTGEDKPRFGLTLSGMRFDTDVTDGEGRYGELVFFELRTKVDEKLFSTRWAGRYNFGIAHLRYISPELTNAFLMGNTALIEVPDDSGGNAYFEFNLAGSRAAVSQATAICREP
ncbi:MAG: hypothetical protein GDA55_08490 [Cellvibrionales bacterium]|nr:hypothetical protein [Cellvibrionales bacterium]